MKRILLLILSLGFLACIGIESFHQHVRKNETHCPLCTVKAQIHSRATLHQTPRLTASTAAKTIESLSSKAPVFNSLRDLAARSPPFTIS